MTHEPSATGTAGRAVLYVDDDAERRTATGRSLAANDLVVTAVDSVAAARDRLADGEFDCLITAFDLGDGDAGELLGSDRVGAADLPVVLYTGDLAAARSLLPRVEEFLRTSQADAQPGLLADLVRSAIRRRADGEVPAAETTG